MLVYIVAGIQLEQSGCHLTSRWEIDRVAEKCIWTARIRQSKGFSVTTKDICMFVFSGKRYLVENVTMYCILSKMIQLINLREIDNIICTKVANFWRECRSGRAHFAPFLWSYSKH